LDDYENTPHSVDLLVGAKGSPTQLILSTLFATDVPTGNIPLAAAEKIAASPLVRESVTLSLGDSASGYCIVGT
jgi:putative ABC transport system permease protein